VTFIIFHYSIGVDGTGFYDVIIMKSFNVEYELDSLIIDFAWYEYQLKWSGAANRQGIVREFHSVWRVVTL